MAPYVLRRVLLMVPTLLGLSLLIFGLVRVMPGDAITARMAEAGTFTPEQVAAFRAEWHLDEPYPAQYLRYLSELVRGDLGTSFYYGTPVRSEILHRLPTTLEIAVLAVVIAAGLAIPLGALAAIRSGTWIDAFVRLCSVLGQAVPDFWLGTLMIVALAFYVRWLPPKTAQPLFSDPIGNLQQVIFPALVLGWSLSAVLMRLVRNSMIEVLRQDYVRTARAKGLTGYRVVVRHAIRNAFLPVLTLIGMQFAFLLGGAVIVESIFTVPGIGLLVLTSIQRRDYNLLQGLVLLFGLALLVINLLVDLAYGFVDPRIRYR